VKPQRIASRRLSLPRVEPWTCHHQRKRPASCINAATRAVGPPVTRQTRTASKDWRTWPAQFAVEHVEALIFTVMDVQRRPGHDRGLEDAQGSARGVLRGLQARIACHANAGRKGIAGQEFGHGYMITCGLPACPRYFPEVMTTVARL
jgi:hypothetical protein